LTDIEGTITDERAERVESDLKEPLEQAMASLPPRLRSVFVLHDVQGWKHEEIARMLGCTVGTSKSQLFKARVRLRGFLAARNIVPGEPS
jgi:RNA polymerase sigma-70 factor (ECF subfamily)